MDNVPEPLLRQLNGGDIISHEQMRAPHDHSDMYILGEYVTDPQLGRLVILYYGSFAILLRQKSDAAWEREMWDTLRHELRHHVEGLAGVDELRREDAQQLPAWRGPVPAPHARR